MPLVILTGFPCSGKSTRSEEIKQFLKVNKEKEVFVVSENNVMKASNISRNELYFSKFICVI